MNGIPNLERLFASVMPEPEELEIEEMMRLQSYRSLLPKTLSELNTKPDEGEFGTLAYAINRHWPTVDFRKVREGRHEASTRSGLYPNLEIPYSSGIENAVSLLTNPTRYGFESVDTQRILTKTHGNFCFSKTEIRPQRNVLVDGRLVPDPLSALELYLDKIEQGIETKIADINGTPQRDFDLALDVGLSLIGFGDAVRKAGEGQKMEAAYLQLVLRAYASSGFNETTYVQRRRLGIGDIPPAIYVMVKAGDLKKAVTPEQFNQLMSQ